MPTTRVKFKHRRCPYARGAQPWGPQRTAAVPGTRPHLATSDRSVGAGRALHRCAVSPPNAPCYKPGRSADETGVVVNIRHEQQATTRPHGAGEDATEHGGRANRATGRRLRSGGSHARCTDQRWLLWLVTITVITASLWGNAAAWVSVARAQNSDWASDWQEGDSSSRCKPSCRNGFTCREGECIAICDPPCPQGAHCSSQGECVADYVAAPVAPQPVAPRSAHPAICQPACRSGFTCIDGECVSACNPPCSANQVCSQGRECIYSPAPGTGTGSQASIVSVTQPKATEAPKKEKPPVKPPEDPSKKSLVNLHMNALGALQFGVTPTLEFGKIVSGYLRVRILNSGLASYLLLPGDSSTDFSWGLGGALGLHIFSAQNGNMRGFFGGVALEYAFVENSDTRRNYAAYRTHTMIPQLDIGYRWGFGRFLLGVGLAAGISVPIYSEDVPLLSIGCNYDCSGERDIHALTNLLIDVGFFL